MPEYIGHPWRPSTPSPPASAPARRRPHRRLLLLGLFALALGTLATVLYVVRAAEERRRVVEAERARFAAYLDEREAPFRALPTLDARAEALLRRTRNADHVARARTLGVPPVARRADALAQARARGLVELRDGPYYAVARLTYSVPFVTLDAAAALDSIGVRFQAHLARHGLPPYRFVVTSVLRTQEDQARLRGVNVNAARGTSSHEFGTTFDLHYRRFVYGGDARAEVAEALGPLPYAFLYDEFARELEAHYADLGRRYLSRIGAALGRALIELENEGVLLALRERQQPVYHVTVARRLAR